MNRPKIKMLSYITVVYLVIAGFAFSQSITVPIENGKNVTSIQSKSESVEYEGKKALKVIADSDGNFNPLVLINDIEFENGTIEIELAGKPREGTGALAKGFIGLAFRMDSDQQDNYECFYLRPVNAVADNEVSKNRSVQYISHPEYPWNRLREDTPGKYETFAKSEPGKWITLKIVVNGEEAKLFVGNDDQPCLTVSDLKHGIRKGSIALWSHTSTEAYFRNLKITHQN